MKAAALIGPRRATASAVAAPSASPTTHTLLAWVSAALAVHGRRVAERRRTVGYGGGGGTELGERQLLPVLVQHDRSRHAERCALLALLGSLQSRRRLA